MAEVLQVRRYGRLPGAAAHHGQILIRESDDPSHIVTTTPAKLAAFIEAVKAGEFDHLVP
ncbi:DUF397 domain-containing protein [Streptomyces sp. NPDC006670]|uniref:DUF397 domain-containing protein n=1 Tax=Streptomyces sp. NPDC006670 TaxID=3154476 RepID=UPI0033D306E0